MLVFMLSVEKRVTNAAGVYPAQCSQLPQGITGTTTLNVSV